MSDEDAASPAIVDEYADAELYDAQNPWGPDDDFYRALAAERGGPVLDLACGTGRLARVLAEDGHDVTGIEYAPPMLARARALDPDGRVEWHQDDARAFDLGRRFPLIIMTAHAFQHMMGAADQVALFAVVARHLAPDGLFAFETRNPGQQDYAGKGAFKLWKRYETEKWGPVEIWVASDYDAAHVIDRVTLRRHFPRTGEVRLTKVDLQYTDAETLDRRLAEAGLEAVRRYGDFGREPFEADSPEIITLCRLHDRAGRAP